MSDQTAALQRQVEELQRTILEERQRHKAESSAVADRIKELEARLGSKPGAVARVSSTRSITTSKTTEGTVTTTTTTTGVKRTSSTVKPLVRRPSGVDAANASDASSSKTAPTRFSKSSSIAAAADKSSAGADKGAAAAAVKSPSPRPASASSTRKTAPQHAWDRFCVVARAEFTVKELELVALETLRSLLDHYHVTSPVERAQIECQWALFQEGKKQADEPTAHDDSQPARAKPFSPMQASEAFVVPSAERKPSLSRRNLLRPEPVKTGNPNQSCDHHTERSPSSKGAVFVDEPSPSNPNLAKQRAEAKVQCTRAVSGPEDQMFRLKFSASGKGRSHSPNAKPAGPHPVEESSAHRGGVRLFSSQHADPSPEFVHRGLRMQATAREARQPSPEIQYRGRRVHPGNSTTTSQIKLA